MGLAKSFTINEFEPIEGSVIFEVVVDDKTVWSGIGNDRADGLLKAILAIEGQEPEVPNN